MNKYKCHYFIILLITLIIATVGYYLKSNNDGDYVYASSIGNVAPNKPVLLSPADGAEVTIPLVLKWKDGGDPDRGPYSKRNYEWYIKDSTGAKIWDRTWGNPDGGPEDCQPFSNQENTWTCTFAVVPTGKLEVGKTYSWAVEAGDGQWGSGYSNEWSFTVTGKKDIKLPTIPKKAAANIAPNKPILLAPTEGAQVSLPLTLKWKDNGDPDRGPYSKRNYEWYIKDSTGAKIWDRTWGNPDGGPEDCSPFSNQENTWTCTSAKVPSGKLKAGMTYTWAVEAGDGQWGSGYSAEKSFTVVPKK